MRLIKLDVWNYAGKFEPGYVNTDGIQSVLKARDEGGETCSIIRWANGLYVIAKGTPDKIAAGGPVVVSVP